MIYPFCFIVHILIRRCFTLEARMSYGAIHQFKLASTNRSDKNYTLRDVLFWFATSLQASLAWPAALVLDMAAQLSECSDQESQETVDSVGKVEGVL